jgi:tetratricopeptide (TPR) repeat protein
MDASREGALLAERAGDRATLARCYLTLDYARMSLGEDVDFSGSTRALEIYTEIGDLGGEATAANVLGGFAFFAGRWEEAAEFYRRSRLARERTGDPSGAAMAKANLAEILLEQGQLDEAEAALVDVLHVWRASNDAGGVALACRFRGLGRARAGEFALAAKYLDESRSTFESIGAMADVIETDVAIADQLVLEGRWDQALGLLDAVADQNLAESGLDHLLPWIHRLRGLAQFSDDPERAMAEIDQSVDVARERGADHEVALALQARQLLATWRDASVDPSERREYLEIIARLGIRPRREPPQPDRVLSGTGIPDQRRT